MNREDIRDKYLPCLLENMKKANYNIKMQTIGVLVEILIKSPDFKSRQNIHSFINEDIANSKSIFDRKIYIIFCAKICKKISKRYFKEVFAWNFLRIS